SRHDLLQRTCLLLTQSGHWLTPLLVRVGTMPCFKPRGDDEAARFHQRCGWFSGSNVAVFGVRAAATYAGGRIYQPRVCPELQAASSGLSQRTQRNWLL